MLCGCAHEIYWDFCLYLCATHCHYIRLLLLRDCSLFICSFVHSIDEITKSQSEMRDTEHYVTLLAKFPNFCWKGQKEESFALSSHSLNVETKQMNNKLFELFNFGNDFGTIKLDLSGQPKFFYWITNSTQLWSKVNKTVQSTSEHIRNRNGEMNVKFIAAIQNHSVFRFPILWMQNWSSEWLCNVSNMHSCMHIAHLSKLCEISERKIIIPEHVSGRWIDRISNSENEPFRFSTDFNAICNNERFLCWWML